MFNSHHTNKGNYKHTQTIYSMECEPGAPAKQAYDSLSPCSILIDTVSVELLKQSAVN